MAAFIARAGSSPPLVMAALGSISGVLSAAIGLGYEPQWLTFPGSLFFLDAGMVPIGALFAAALAVGLWIATQRVLLLPIAALATMYAWSAAIHTATSIITNTSDAGRLIAGSLAAGAVGAAITQLGAALALAELRRPWSLASTTLIGAALGLIFYAGERNFVDSRLLFVLWQPATAWSIGMGLARRDHLWPSIARA